MTDPFQDVDAAGPSFVELIVDGLEKRASEDQMTPVINAYLDDIAWAKNGLHVEVGSGSGAIARRMAARAGNGRVIGVDPSPGLTDAANKLAANDSQVSFEVGDGAALRFAPASIDTVVMHTVLSHVREPAALLAEAMRVLKPGGSLIVCDADYEKLSFGNFRGDPLDMCARFFVDNFVTQPNLAAALRALVQACDFRVQQFRVTNRVVTGGDGNLVTVVLASNQMVERGLVGRPLADALVDEYKRRRDTNSLYAFTPFCTLVARKPETV